MRAPRSSLRAAAAVCSGDWVVFCLLHSERGGDGRSGRTSSARSIFNNFLIISCGIWLCLQSLRSLVIETVRENGERPVIQKPGSRQQ